VRSRHTAVPCPPQPIGLHWFRAITSRGLATTQFSVAKAVQELAPGCGVEPQDWSAVILGVSYRDRAVLHMRHFNAVIGRTATATRLLPDSTSFVDHSLSSTSLVSRSGTSLASLSATSKRSSRLFSDGIAASRRQIGRASCRERGET